ncbi:hypothetical protein J7M23_07815 [Candidatus Sumerlaeota bacterium]|nr:hypothetical protein [Candidatus Sumerlaeota bacterium]
MVIISSDPPNAEILYTTEKGDSLVWQPWCATSKGISARTPKRHITFRRGCYFFRTHLDGYYDPEPQLVELLPLKITRVHFSLQERPETFARRQREKGLVFYKNQWVEPVKAGLVNYKGKWMSKEEKFAIEQKEKGLVLFRGKWVSPAEKAELIAEEYRAKGLIHYKGRWVKREEYEKEKQIDETVAKIVSTSDTQQRLEPPKVVGIIRSNKCKLRLFNGTGNVALFYISGTESSLIRIEEYDSKVIMLLPGEYAIAVTEEEPLNTEERKSAHAQVTKARLRGGFQYSLTYEGEPLRLPVTSKNVDKYIKEKFEIPEIEIPVSEDEIKKIRRPKRPSGSYLPRKR